MCKSDVFNRVLEAVAHETEIEAEEIVGKGRTIEVVDARWLAVILLYKSGMYPMRIAETMRVTPRYVQYIITGFSGRKSCNPILRMNYEAVKNKLGL